MFNTLLFTILILLSTTTVEAGKKKVFTETIEEAKIFFTPLYASYGKTFTIESYFDYDENNAKAAATTVKDFYIELYGGLLKTKQGNKDSLRAAICHEIGHHFGGKPLVPSYYEEYLLFRGSVEGQADYWSAHYCLKKWFLGEDQEKALVKYGFSFSDLNFCKKYHKDYEDSLICTRIISAYKNMLGLPMETSPFIHILKPKSKYKIPLAAMAIHPKKDCRLETIYAASICNDKSEYGCKFSGTRPEGSRPLCWVGLEEILTNELMSGVSDKRLIKDLKRLNLDGFHYSKYEDDDVLDYGNKLSEKYRDFIDGLNL